MPLDAYASVVVKYLHVISGLPWRGSARAVYRGSPRLHTIVTPSVVSAK